MVTNYPQLTASWKSLRGSTGAEDSAKLVRRLVPERIYKSVLEHYVRRVLRSWARRNPY